MCHKDKRYNNYITKNKKQEIEPNKMNIGGVFDLMNELLDKNDHFLVTNDNLLVDEKFVIKTIFNNNNQPLVNENYKVYNKKFHLSLKDILSYVDKEDENDDEDEDKEDNEDEDEDKEDNEDEDDDDNEDEEAIVEFINMECGTDDDDDDKNDENYVYKEKKKPAKNSILNIEFDNEDDDEDYVANDGETEENNVIMSVVVDNENHINPLESSHGSTIVDMTTTIAESKVNEENNVMSLVLDDNENQGKIKNTFTLKKIYYSLTFINSCIFLLSNLFTYITIEFLMNKILDNADLSNYIDQILAIPMFELSNESIHSIHNQTNQVKYTGLMNDLHQSKHLEYQKTITSLGISNGKVWDYGASFVKFIDNNNIEYNDFNARIINEPNRCFFVTLGVVMGINPIVVQYFFRKEIIKQLKNFRTLASDNKFIKNEIEDIKKILLCYSIALEYGELVDAHILQYIWPNELDQYRIGYINVTGEDTARLVVFQRDENFYSNKGIKNVEDIFILFNHNHFSNLILDKSIRRLKDTFENQIGYPILFYFANNNDNISINETLDLVQSELFVDSSMDTSNNYDNISINETLRLVGSELFVDSSMDWDNNNNENEIFEDNNENFADQHDDFVCGDLLFKKELKHYFNSNIIDEYRKLLDQAEELFHISKLLKFPYENDEFITNYNFDFIFIYSIESGYLLPKGKLKSDLLMFNSMIDLNIHLNSILSRRQLKGLLRNFSYMKGYRNFYHYFKILIDEVRKDDINILDDVEGYKKIFKKLFGANHYEYNIKDFFIILQELINDEYSNYHHENYPYKILPTNMLSQKMRIVISI